MMKKNNAIQNTHGITPGTDARTNARTDARRDAINRVSTTETTAPELRFPEFHDDWQVKTLGECFEMLQNNTLSRAELNNKCGDYQNVHYGDVLIKYGSILDISKEQLPYINNNNAVEKYEKSLLKDGDVIIADTAEDETVGKCTEIINVGNKKIISGLHTIPIRPTIDFAKCFIGLYFNSNVWHSQLLRIMQGTKVTSISKSQLKNISVCFPTLSEQRKIAACLSSLDDLIKSVGNKIELLKQHKKGLMQKLFPSGDGMANGTNNGTPNGTFNGMDNGTSNGRDAINRVSTTATTTANAVPELRFPEFSGDWQMKTLGDIMQTNSGKDYKHLNIGNIPVYGTGGYMLSVNDKLSDIDAIGIGRKGTIDKPQYLKAPFWTVDTLFFLTTKNGINLRFMYYLTQTINWKKYSEQTGVPSLTRNSIDNIIVSIPTNEAEQRKIAACLSSLDAEIQKYEQKLQMLEQHKKGLMQKMYVRRL